MNHINMIGNDGGKIKEDEETETLNYFIVIRRNSKSCSVCLVS